MLKEFKEFAMKGNVVDLAVGMIIGGGFGKIISSLVNDIIMPLIANLFSMPDFSNLKFALVDKGEATPFVMYGSFIQNIIDFIIIAFCIFLVVKSLNSMKKKEEVVEEVAEPVVSDEVKLLSEILETLKSK